MKIKEIVKQLIAKVFPSYSVKYRNLIITGPMQDRGFLKALSQDNREPFTVEQILNRVTDETVFLDVGGHLGQFSLAVAAQLRHLNTQKVFVFEPFSRSFEYLERNIEANNLQNIIKSESLCISDKNGVIYFYADPLQSDYSSTVKNSDGSSVKSKIEVKTVTIDSYFKSISPPTLVKIDVEGAELSVLRGMTEIISKYKPTLLIECNSVALNKAGESSQSLTNILRQYYSKIWIIREEQKILEAFDIKKIPENHCVNLLCEG